MTREHGSVGWAAPPRRPQAERPRPAQAQALSAEERARIVAVANEPRFADAPPARIVPALADEGVYIASESSFHRVLRDHRQMNRRGRACLPRASRPPTTHLATRPGEVWCWDVTFLPTTVQGRWFYLYLILDLYSRKIVGFEVHDSDTAEHAAHLARRTALAEGVHAMPVRPVLHGDNGATLKGTTVLAMLHWLGISPSVLAPAGQRRQCFRRGAVPHRQVPPRIPGQGICRSGGCPDLGGAVRAVVQPRASAQRHPLRHPGAALPVRMPACSAPAMPSTKPRASATPGAGAGTPATGRRWPRSR